MYDERRGLFEPLVRPEARSGRRRVTWAALAPLALPDLPEDIGRRLVEDHLLDDRAVLAARAAAVGAPHRAELLTRDDGPVDRRYWRGPTWINAAWLVWLGLTRLGYARTGGDARHPDLSAVLAAGTARVLRPIHGRRDGRGRLRVVLARDGDVRGRPASPPPPATSACPPELIDRRHVAAEPLLDRVRALLAAARTRRGRRRCGRSPRSEPRPPGAPTTVTGIRSRPTSEARSLQLSDPRRQVLVRHPVGHPLVAEREHAVEHARRRCRRPSPAGAASAPASASTRSARS